MICEICNKEFLLISRQGGNNRKSCYECIPEGLERAERNLLRRKLLNQKIKEDKIKIGCQICGYNKCAAALEWHHMNNDKDHDPADAIKRGLDAYNKEISKCILVCANCHREIHNKNI